VAGPDAEDEWCAPYRRLSWQCAANAQCSGYRFGERIAACSPPDKITTNRFRSGFVTGMRGARLARSDALWRRQAVHVVRHVWTHRRNWGAACLASATGPATRSRCCVRGVTRAEWVNIRPMKPVAGRHRGPCRFAKLCCTSQPASCFPVNVHTASATFAQLFLLELYLKFQSDLQSASACNRIDTSLTRSACMDLTHIQIGCMDDRLQQITFFCT
jgi:hypothetical protein